MCVFLCLHILFYTQSMYLKRAWCFLASTTDQDYKIPIKELTRVHNYRASPCHTLMSHTHTENVFLVDRAQFPSKTWQLSLSTSTGWSRKDRLYTWRKNHLLKYDTSAAYTRWTMWWVHLVASVSTKDHLERWKGHFLFILYFWVTWFKLHVS